MGISTQTEDIIKFYNQSISLDLNQITQINSVEVGFAVTTGIGSTQQIRVWGPQELIDNYNVPIQKLDKEIVSINNQIRDLQELKLDIGQEANSVGCGTTAWSEGSGFTTTIVLRDESKYAGYGYTAPNPFYEIDGVLTNGNAGIGTKTYINPVSIGSYFDPIQDCNDFLLGCTSELCTGYATSITNIQSQITSLQSERNDLIDKVNTLKESRSDFEIQQYAYTQSKNRLNQKIQRTQDILTFLQDPDNAQWL